MKILVIWRLLTVGGVNAGWRNRAIYFKKHGIDVEFLYTKDLGGLHIMEDVAPVYLTKDKHEIVSIINNNNYDAIIVVDTQSAYKWIQKSNFNGPVIVEARTPELLKLKRHLHSFDGVKPVSLIVPSNYQKRLVSILTDEIPIHTIYNGVDTSFYKAIPKEKIDFKKDPIVPEGKKIIGWIGRLDNRKNWKMFIEIAKNLNEQRQDIEFWVIGGNMSVGRDEFEMTWHSEDMTDVMKWFKVIPYQEMPQVYSKIRESGGCTVATTKTESFGNTFIESMICGVPVIAPNMMPMTEIIKHGSTGLLYEQNKIEDCVNKINSLLDNPVLHGKMSKEAIKHVQQHFSIEKVAHQYMNLLFTLVSKSDISQGGEKDNGTHSI